MSSSHKEAKNYNKIGNEEQIRDITCKLSYRITYTKEYCTNTKITMRAIVQENKYTLIKQLLKDIIDINVGKSEDDKLNIDLSVYSTGVHKMRMVGQYKYKGQKDRINKLIKGNIEDTIITLTLLTP